MLENHLVYTIRQLQNQLVDIYSGINSGDNDLEQVKLELESMILSIDRENPSYDFERINVKEKCTFCGREDIANTKIVGGYTILETCTDCEEDITVT